MGRVHEVINRNVFMKDGLEIYAFDEPSINVFIN